MKVLNLLKQKKVTLPYQLGPELGFDGANGQVFCLPNTNDLVIKLAVLFDYPFQDFNKKLKQIEQVLSYTQTHRPHMYVNVFEYDQILESFRSSVNGPQKFFSYYYVMEKCYPITDDEKKVFHSILSHEDSNKKKFFSSSKLKEMLYGMSFGLEFDLDQVEKFYYDSMNSFVYQADNNPRNIMKDKFGNFKWIDLDQCLLKIDLKKGLIYETEGRFKCT